MAHQTLVVLDFGSQVTQLIARRVRELGVYAEILPYHTSAEKLAARAPKAIILSGGPSSLYDEGAPQVDPDVLRLGVPVLGICYGLYLIVACSGGQVDRATRREYGPALLEVGRAEGPLSRLRVGERMNVWMSHGDTVVALPPGFRSLASSANCEHAVVHHPDRKLWACSSTPRSRTPSGATS